MLTLTGVVAQTPELEAALQLRTGEDAIAFFARYGNSTPLKFVYCNRSDQVRWGHVDASPRALLDCRRACALGGRCRSTLTSTLPTALPALPRPSVAFCCACLPPSRTDRTTWCVLPQLISTLPERA